MSERETAQLSTRVDAELLKHFADCCKSQGESQREVIERLIAAHITHKENRHTLHLDGRLCPLSEMLNAIRDSVSRDMETAAQEVGARAINALARSGTGGK